MRLFNAIESTNFGIQTICRHPNIFSNVVLEVRNRHHISCSTDKIKSCHNETERDDSESIINKNNADIKMDNIGKKQITFMVVGLGNHTHQDTRHSIGMRAVNQLADRFNLKWEKSKPRSGNFCSTVVNFSNECSAKIHLFKAKALMNVSGVNVARTANSLSVKADQIYLIHDELDMAVGKLGLKNGGSSRGHNGVLSCISSARSSGLWVDESDSLVKNLPRLRIGIGRPHAKSQVIPYVLSSLPTEDIEALDQAIHEGLNLLLKHMATRLSITERVTG